MEREEAGSELCEPLTRGASSTSYSAPLKAPVRTASIANMQLYLAEVLSLS